MTVLLASIIRFLEFSLSWMILDGIYVCVCLWPVRQLIQNVKEIIRVWWCYQRRETGTLSFFVKPSSRCLYIVAISERKTFLVFLCFISQTVRCSISISEFSVPLQNMSYNNPLYALLYCLERLFAWNCMFSAAGGAFICVFCFCSSSTFWILCHYILLF